LVQYIAVLLQFKQEIAFAIATANQE